MGAKKRGEATCRCSDLIFHQNKIHSGRKHITTQLRSRHTKWAWNTATLNLHTIFQSNEALLLKDFRSPTSLSRRLSITRKHKGNFYKLQRGALYNKKQSLPEIVICYALKEYCFIIYLFV